MQTHSFKVGSDLAEVPDMARRLRAAWASMGLADEEALSLEICVVEAVNNAIEHAYSNQPGHWVDVTTSLAGDALTTEVRDRGRSMPASRLDPSETMNFDPADISSLPERGMGLAIMRKVMDAITYDSRPGCNTLTLTKTVSVPAAQDGGEREKESNRAR